MKRRIRRRHASPEEKQYVPWFARVPLGVYWTVVAVITLVLVLGWDRQAQQEAKEQVATAEELKDQGAYEDAIARYKRALSNARLSRKAKADVAIRIADTYYQHFENYDLANSFYVRARQLYPKAIEQPDIQERLRVSRQRMTGRVVADNGDSEDMTRSRTVTEVFAKPPEDMEGPVVAEVGDRQIHAGEIARALSEGGTHVPGAYEQDPKALEARVREYLDKLVLYEAGVAAGLDREASTRHRVYDYNRTLVADRALEENLMEFQRVTDSDVERYYRENRSQFSTPVRIGLAMIKTDDEARAREAQAALREGVPFGDVATSYSVDASRERTGVIGQLGAGEDTIPGVGKAPEVIRALAEMAAGEVSNITRIGDAYYIFRVISKSPGREISLEEARPRIVAQLRSATRGQQTQKVREQLRTKFPPKIMENGLSALASYAGAATRATADRQTTPTVTADETTPTAEGVQ
jgi:tetratricopeptide (TPR) repeat protein